MGTKIEWCDHTLNPIVGCQKVSEGCDNCYAEKMAYRLKCMGLPQYQDVVDKGRWTGDVCFNPKQLDKIHEIPYGKRVFIGSMCDMFNDKIPRCWLEDIFLNCFYKDDMKYIFLTKRPQNMSDFIDGYCSMRNWEYNVKKIWLGVTCETQERADERIPILLDIPALTRFVSLEPLLSAIDISEHLKTGKLHWVIIGGETGKNARPMEYHWVKNIIAQCKKYNVPVFLKSWGEWIPIDTMINTIYLNLKRSLYVPIGELYYYKIGKKNSGYLFNGKEYREFPKQ